MSAFRRVAVGTVAALVLPPLTVVWAASAIGEAAIEHARAIRDARRALPRLRARLASLEHRIDVVEREREEDAGFYRDFHG